jgi:hypothetical protein
MTVAYAPTAIEAGVTGTLTFASNTTPALLEIPITAASFKGVGLTDVQIAATASMRDVYNAWDAWVLPKIEARYSIKLERSRVKLVVLFDMIRQAQKPKAVH